MDVLTVALLDHLGARGITVDLVGASRISLRGRPGSLNDGLRQRVQRDKPKLLGYLERIEDELESITRELAQERDWLVARRFVPRMERGQALRDHLASIRRTRGLLDAVAEARRHYVAAVACEFLPVAGEASP